MKLPLLKSFIGLDFFSQRFGLPSYYSV